MCSAVTAHFFTAFLCQKFSQKTEDYISGRRFATPTLCNSTALWLGETLLHTLYCILHCYNF